MHLLILYGVVLPAAAAALVVAPLRVRAHLAPRLLGSIAVAGGFVAAFYALGFAEHRPQEGWVWLALAGALVGGLPLPAPVRVVAWAGVAAFVCYRVIPMGLFDSEDWGPWRVRCYAVVAGCVLILGVMAPLARRVTVFVWALAVAGGAGVLFWADIATFAQMAGALAATLAAVAIVDRTGKAAAGAVGVAAVLHPALLAAGCFNHFSDVQTWVFAVAALAPALGFVLSALPFAKPPGRG
jgi:hypothetical protein